MSLYNFEDNTDLLYSICGQDLWVQCLIDEPGYAYRMYYIKINDITVEPGDVEVCHFNMYKIGEFTGEYSLSEEHDAVLDNIYANQPVDVLTGAEFMEYLIMEGYLYDL